MPRCRDAGPDDGHRGGGDEADSNQLRVLLDIEVTGLLPTGCALQR